MSAPIPEVGAEVSRGSDAAQMRADGQSKASLRRFFLAIAAVMVLLVGSAWVWAVEGRMSFFNPEYPMWLAKFRMVDECAYGDTIIIGDSRAMAGILPDQLGGNVTNLALPGGTPIESYYLLRRMDRCKAYPKRAVISFLPLFLTRVHMYWLRPALYNLMSFEEMEEVRRLSVKLDDPILYSPNRFASALDSVKNYSYHISLPSYYFSAMIAGRFVERRAQNEVELAATLKQRGHHYFGMAPSTAVVPEDGYVKQFKPSAVLNFYMDEMLRKLDAHGVEIDFVGTPVNPGTVEMMSKSVVASFKDYLTSIEHNLPNFHILGDIMLVLPNDSFGDSEHVNPKGAEEWTTAIGSLLDGFTAASQQ